LNEPAKVRAKESDRERKRAKEDEESEREQKRVKESKRQMGQRKGERGKLMPIFDKERAKLHRTAARL
jgi:hypothetical protein